MLEDVVHEIKGGMKAPHPDQSKLIELIKNASGKSNIYNCFTNMISNVIALLLC